MASNFLIRPEPRLCVMRRDKSSQEYGFTLLDRGKEGQFAHRIAWGSIAEKSGLRMGDRVLAVNGFCVLVADHKQVGERIHMSPLRCSLLVMDQRGIEWHMKRRLPLPTKSNESMGNEEESEANEDSALL